MMQIPVEATAFLGVVGGFLVLLVVFLLYLNKMLCFAASEGLPCCDERPWKKECAAKTKELGNAYNYEQQEQESSTDSDDEMLYRLQQSASYSGGLRKTASSLGRRGADGSGPCQDPPPPPPPSSLPLMDTPTRPPKASTSGTTRVKVTGKSALKMMKTAAANGSTGDLISLAEKGRVGVSASSGSSETSSPGTPDDGPGPGAVGAGPQAQRQGPSAPLTVDRATFGRSEQEVQAGTDKSILCAFRTSLDEHEEHLFDVSDLNRVDDSCVQQLISKCGSLETAFAYDAPTRKMTVRVLRARDVPTKDRGGANNVQVRLLLLPSKKQKHKTKIRQGSSPCFDESFLFHRITPEEVSSLGVRFRLYGCERMRRERMIGESVVGFACLNLDRETTHWLTLEPRSNLAGSDSRTDVSSLARSDSTGSTQSMQHGGVPELLLGLAYNGTTGRLSAEVVKGSHFRNLAMNRAPDTYVKLTLVSSNQQEMARSKTSIRRGQPNPLFKETFMFQVALFQLPEVTLTVAVYNKRSMSRKEMIGWFALGLNSSGEEELAHWNDMRESRGEQVCRWHILLES